MDAFETIRASAAALHSKLVAAGADPDKPMNLVAAAVADLDLELSWLPENDPVLKGARALFDEQGGIICCLDQGSPGERACLVAHELGHVCVHAGSSECTNDDIDPSRSMEAAPVGLQRVEDYGVRERRELQANVFAREFLLPRPAAHERHLSGQTASGIAGRLGLPIDLVRQQLLDALLLPPVPSEVFEAIAHTVREDPSQDRAAEHRGSAFQLQAGPGAGKTRTLVKRVLSLLCDSVDPASILVLTFSNRAAGELSDRLMAVVPDQAPRIWIGTFHAFGLDLIRRYHDRLGLPPDPALFDRSDAIEVLEEVLPILPLVHYRNLWDPALVLRDVVGAISRAKDELVDDSEYRALAQVMRERAINPEDQEEAAKALEVAQVYKIYQETLRSRRSVDFGDLIMRPTLLIESDEAVRAAIATFLSMSTVTSTVQARDSCARSPGTETACGWSATLGNRFIVSEARLRSTWSASPANMRVWSSIVLASTIDQVRKSSTPLRRSRPTWPHRKACCLSPLKPTKALPQFLRSFPVSRPSTMKPPALPLAFVNSKLRESAFAAKPCFAEPIRG
jgi:DNA helicase-2/ATP-dependent DNA helicase PcrA